MAAKRMRADIWVNLQSRIESEMERSGLSVNEVVNIALADYFGLSPRGKSQNSHQPASTSLPSVSQINAPESGQVVAIDEQEEDYI